MSVNKNMFNLKIFNLMKQKENVSAILGGFVSTKDIVCNNPRCSVSCDKQRNA